MTDEQKKGRLKELLSDVFLVHCAGCDEWGCGGEEESGTFHEPDDELLDRLLAEIKSWSGQ